MALSITAPSTTAVFYGTALPNTTALHIAFTSSGGFFAPTTLYGTATAYPIAITCSRVFLATITLYATSTAAAAVAIAAC